MSYNPTPLLDRYLVTGAVSLLAGTADSAYSSLLLQLGRDCQQGAFLNLRAVPDIDVVVADLRSPYSYFLSCLLHPLDYSPECWIAAESDVDILHSDNVVETMFRETEPLWNYGGDAQGSFPLRGTDAREGPHCAYKSRTRPRLLLVRGLDRLFPETASYQRDVIRIVHDIQLQASDHACAVLATISASRPQRGYDLPPRDRVYGSSMWSACVDDILLLDRIGSGRYRLHITRDGHAPLHYDLASGESGLILADPTAASQTAPSPAGDSIPDKLYLLLDAVPLGLAIPHDILLAAMAPAFAVSARSWKRWLSHAVDTGRLVKVSRGVYMRPPGSHSIQ